MNLINDIIAKISNSQSLVIYGAGTMGRAVLTCLSEEPFNLTIHCFIVKCMDGNRENINGVPVRDIEEACEYRDSTVLIALNGKLIPEVIHDLKAAGFTDLVPISFDGDEWTVIREKWFRANNILPDNILRLSDLSTSEEDSLHVRSKIADRFRIYVVHSIFDRILSETSPNQSYELNIQVGAALTDKALFEIRDSSGNDNISDKNRQYCELTGIYWAWKNDKSDYIGFSHYRRKFVLAEDQLCKILSENTDVVVTEPIVNFATVKGQYAKDHVEADWTVFMNAIWELAPDYYEAALKIQDGIYYFAYNMFIMKKHIFQEYCSFIFPILRRCEEVIGTKEDVYQNRYVGFLAERLLSIFLKKNKDYCVAIAQKHFIE